LLVYRHLVAFWGVFEKRIWAESAPIPGTLRSRRRSLKKRFKSCSGFAAGAASESLFRAPRGRSTQPLSGSTASRSSRESLSRSPSSNPFSAKTSCTRVFSGSRCGQTPCLTIVFRWALTQGRFCFASIPSSRFSIAYFAGFRAHPNGPLGGSLPDP
jgi:hypothetical protein